VPFLLPSFLPSRRSPSTDASVVNRKALANIAEAFASSPNSRKTSLSSKRLSEVFPIFAAHPELTATVTLTKDFDGKPRPGCLRFVLSDELLVNELRELTAVLPVGAINAQSAQTSSVLVGVIFASAEFTLYPHVTPPARKAPLLDGSDGEDYVLLSHIARRNMWDARWLSCLGAADSSDSESYACLPQHFPSHSSQDELRLANGKTVRLDADVFGIRTGQSVSKWVNAGREHLPVAISRDCKVPYGRSLLSLAPLAPGGAFSVFSSPDPIPANPLLCLDKRLRKPALPPATEALVSALVSNAFAAVGLDSVATVTKVRLAVDLEAESGDLTFEFALTPGRVFSDVVSGDRVERFAACLDLFGESVHFSQLSPSKFSVTILHEQDPVA
jgi:hypothetical protein